MIVHLPLRRLRAWITAPVGSAAEPPPPRLRTLCERLRPALRAGSLAGSLALGLVGCSEPGGPLAHEFRAAPDAAASAPEARATAAGGEAIEGRGEKPAVLAALGALRATEAERQALQALYAPQGGSRWWTDERGGLTARGREALALFAAAADDGLDPADYQARELQEALARPAAAEQAATLELRISLSAMRYLRDLQAGRVEPRSVGFKLHGGGPGLDLAAQVRQLATAPEWGAAVAALRPAWPQYAALRGALRQYRDRAAREGEAPAVPVVTRVRPGEPYAGVPALRQRLALLGDLDPGRAAASAVPAPAPAAPGPAGGGRASTPRYEGELVEAVRRFQARHGLEPDGVLGKATFAALNVPLADRVRQIELAMERLRWVPRIAERFVAVNIPMFRLWAGDSTTATSPPLAMRVIVGRALDTETPVMFDQMRYLVFSPYWNVPRSITRNEILPALRRDPHYLERHQMELVRGERDDSPVVAATPEALEALARGELRVRQRPGPKNSLGQVKFIFPNDASVYLHGTPARELFGRDRRDMSHGCVRVEDPVALAQWLLHHKPQWTRERILEAMEAGRPTQVNLGRPVPVLLFYVTAMVMPDTGAVHFAQDIYGHDRRLLEALARRRPS
ncbi:murein L,D-transpeptidase [Schlegelella aquatica]|uniref:L,D-transpeptidase family protein n=1 Tax=Caldimonas aquatica TaxID=376175 RepID=UPI00375313B6